MTPENAFEKLVVGSLKTMGFASLCTMIYADVRLGMIAYDDLVAGNIVEGLSELMFATLLACTVPTLGYILYKV